MDVILLPFRLLAGLVRFLAVLIGIGKWGVKTAKFTKAAVTRELRCKRGCPPQPADGIWSCSTCGATREGWVWSYCPSCKTAPAFVDCQSCGVSIVNPKV